MIARRVERLVTLLLLLVTACAIPPALRGPAPVATQHVAVVGEEADTLGEVALETQGGLVTVTTHDGRSLVVREGALGGAGLVPGTWVLLRRDGRLEQVRVVRALDDYLEIERAGASEIVGASDVVARLHHGPSTPEVLPPVAPDVVTPPTLPPPTPLAQMTLLEASPTTRVARLVECSAAGARLALHDGSELVVPMSDLHPLRVRAGDHVTALWNESPYPGVVMATRDDLVRIRWEDESVQWVDADDVQSVEAAASGAVHGCPTGHAVLFDEGMRTRIGRVIACEADRATVLDDAGTPRTVARETLAPLALRVGDPVQARWSGTPYDAVVLAIGDRIHVRWYDGSENDVDPADLVSIRVREPRTGEAPSCPTGA